MSLTVNNKTVDYVENETIQELLTRLKFTFPLVIVKLNGKHVSRDRYSDVIIPKEADIQVIHMISGG